MSERRGHGGLELTTSHDVRARPDAGNGQPSGVSAASRTSTTTVIGRHEHTISGYSLLKGIGDGEPIASDRFMVGGHEWVLLFYPDGKRSMSDGGAPPTQQDDPYAALFVALIGEGPRPLGVVQSGQGRVVRAFHRFTLVDQSGNGRHITKGRQREQGAVKISCARQDPQARNCHGYRKFVRRSVLEASGSGYLVDDVVVIRYEIELVVTNGGALNKNAKLLPAASVNVPSYPTIGKHLVGLLYDRNDETFDCTFDVEGEKFRAHKLILSSRSSVFAGMLRTGAAMKEGREGVLKLNDVKADVFRLLLHFVYADEIPRGGGAEASFYEHTARLGAEEAPGAAGDELTTRNGRASDELALDVPMTQHLLVAADKFDLSRLRAMCEARLCDSVDMSTVANTLLLAELNHAYALKRACMGFIAANLSDVMSTEGYEAMNTACPHLASEILSAVAEMRPLRPQGAPLALPQDTGTAIQGAAAANPATAAAFATAAAAAARPDRDIAQGGVLAVPPTVAHDLTNLSFPAMSTLSNFLSRAVQPPTQALDHPPPSTPHAATLVNNAGEEAQREVAAAMAARHAQRGGDIANVVDDSLLLFASPQAQRVPSEAPAPVRDGDEIAGGNDGQEGRRVRPRR